MTGTFLIRTDADNSTGYGHLMRCLSLAAELRKRDRQVIFVMNRADRSARELIRQHDHGICITSAGDDLMAEARELSQDPDRARAIVLDFSHQHNLARAERVPEYVEALRGAFPVIAMLDGLGKDSVAGRVARLDVDLLVAPYVGADREAVAPAGVTTRFAGPQYLAFSPAFQPFAGEKRRVRRVADRVLITFGGTDPCRITLKALSAIEAIRHRKLDVRVIIGPGFEKALADEIGVAATASVHAPEVIAAPTSLARHMAWCDLAITGSGLTKYELALTGTPSIQISIDDVHARVNQEFARAGSALHLGVNREVTVSHLAEEIRIVLDNAEQRREMSHRGQALTDGRGAERIVSKLLELEGAFSSDPHRSAG